ncbi:hypothetical protein Naga_102008g1 [Nannochloropsis gaditana]|uniref:Uncharacterized protein n=1 Tax=Nannochloropsis gaditana TaxID=72520 RepID=W7TIH0_9STRA|nr:hypothetical protein Naga_102008g1 [Nannochloropsis gaditana]
MQQEARRLQRHLPDASIVRLEGSGHISLDARVNMTDILMRHPKLFAQPKAQREKDYVRDFVKPSPQYIERYMNIVEQYLGTPSNPSPSRPPCFLPSLLSTLCLQFPSP